MGREGIIHNKIKQFSEKLDMYDMIIANLVAGHSIIEPSQRLDSSQLAIGFSNISSSKQLTKYFMISKFPDFIKPKFIDVLRENCLHGGVRMNFYFYCSPHTINWDSPEMKNKMNVWKNYSEKTPDTHNVFEYRTKRGDELAKNRIILSTKYLNEAELDHRRSLLKTMFIIEISADRDEDSLADMAETVSRLKDTCSKSEIKLTELRINMIDWIKSLSPFSLKRVENMNTKFAKKILTDDILANFNSLKQGRVGTYGVPLGIDVLNGGAVINQFKEDPDAADNWLVCAGTGSGKSLWLKALISYLVASGFVISAMDYEGDEYTNIANYIKAGNKDDAKIISMGKSSTEYFDPCEIPDLTGDDKVDCDLKDSAIEIITSIFRLIVCGIDKDFSKEQARVISLAIQRMYDTVGVTDDKKTWSRSKGLRLKDIYYEIKEMVESKELLDSDADNLKYKAAISIVDSASLYFEPGESKSGVFKNPISANELYKAKFILFSFGMKGASHSTIDPVILALKQLSVAYVNIQISNHCKYVKKCFNVKVWEEFQRWGNANGSADIITNIITGGRKRGDVNFIVTNDLDALLDDTNTMSTSIRQNIQNYVIGKIKDKKTREKFCERFELKEIIPTLAKIAKASSTKNLKSGRQNRYKHAFCVVMEDGKRATVKASVPKSLIDSKLFRTGVEVDRSVN